MKRSLVLTCALLAILAFVSCRSDRDDRRRSPRGATLNPPSLLYSDINAAVAAANPGDIIMLPAGDVTWSNNEQLVVTTRIGFIGQGTNTTKFHRGSGSAPMFYFHNLGNGNSSNLLVEIANLYLDCGSVAFGCMEIGNTPETNRNVRIHNVFFDNIQARGITLFGLAEGLMDHCQFNAYQNLNAQGISVQGRQVTGLVNSSENWQLGVFPDTWYIEDCGFYYKYDNDSLIDGYYKTKWVFRHNWMTNGNYLQHHNGPTVPGAPNQGLRYCGVLEFYNNFWIDTATNNVNENGVVLVSALRAGWGVAFSNRHYAASSILSSFGLSLVQPQLHEYRSSGTNVFTGARLTNATIAFGGGGYTAGDILTVRSNNAGGGFAPIDYPGKDPKINVLTVDGSGQVTSVNVNTGGQYSVNFSSYPLPDLVSNKCIGGTGSNFYGNLSFGLYLPSYCITGSNIFDGNFNTNALMAGYPGLDMPGWGDPITWSATNTIQTFHGYYFWSNYVNDTTPLTGFVHIFGATSDSINNVGWLGVNGWTVPTATNLVASGRDFFDNTPKPGYTPAPYPHPLQSASFLSTDPQITTQPQSQTVCIGQSATFTIAASGTLPMAFQWYNGEIPQTGQTNTSFTIANNTVATTVFCTVSNSVSTVTSATASLSVISCFAPNVVTNVATAVGGAVQLGGPARVQQ